LEKILAKTPNPELLQIIPALKKMSEWAKTKSKVELGIFCAKSTKLLDWKTTWLL
jgi:hypothetical protein